MTGTASRRAALERGAGYLALWIVLMPSAKPGDLVMGVLAAIAATWVSLQLRPPAAGRLRFGALVGLMPHYAWESVRGGVDVARRALDPRLPLNPGIIECPLDLPRGLARNTFASITSLLPGTVACGDQRDGLVYHCLDVDSPVVAQLREEERLLAQALITGTDRA